MVDIPVTFGTNASAIAAQIEAAAASTAKAAGATVKHSQAVKVDDAESLKMAKAAALVTAAMHAQTPVIEANAAALHRAAAAAREHAAAGDLAQEAMHQHTHAGWSQAARVGGFRHEMHAAEFAQGALSGGPAGLAVGAGLLGALGLEKFVEHLNEASEALKEDVHAQRELDIACGANSYASLP